MSSATQSAFVEDAWQSPRNARTLRAYMALRNQEIAQRIRALREAKGSPPQTKVAQAIAVGERTYQTWEAGEAKPEYRNLEKLAVYFGVSEEFILTGIENTRLESPVVVSDRMEGGFEEFRQYVRDIRRDIADAAETATREREDIQKLLEAQQELLTEQQHILEDMRRVAAGLPSEDELRAVRTVAEGAQQIAQAAEANRAARDARTEDQTSAGAGEA